MMLRIWKAAFIFAALFASPAIASDATNGIINYPHGMTGGAVLFFSDGARSTPPACQINVGPQRWALDASSLQGQSQLSILLTAYAMKKHIFIHGTGTCSVWHDTETVDYFYISD